jgi:hypothetical protein
MMRSALRYYEIPGIGSHTGLPDGTLRPIGRPIQRPDFTHDLID